MDFSTFDWATFFQGLLSLILSLFGFALVL